MTNRKMPSLGMIPYEISPKLGSQRSGVERPMTAAGGNEGQGDR